MNKSELFCIGDPFSPEQNLRELSLLDNDEEANSKSALFTQKNTKKVSIIDGWVKQKDKQADRKIEMKTNLLQNYRKMICPSVGTVKSHYSHIAFTPKPVNIHQIKTQTIMVFQQARQIKRRPMSSTIARHDHFECIKPSNLPTSRQKSHHQYLKKHSGISPKKDLLKGKRKTIQTLVYPIFEHNHFDNPEKLVPNIGRISYLVKLNKRNSSEVRN